MPIGSVKPRLRTEVVGIVDQHIHFFSRRDFLQNVVQHIPLIKVRPVTCDLGLTKLFRIRPGMFSYSLRATHHHNSTACTQQTLYEVSSQETTRTRDDNGLFLQAEEFLSQRSRHCLASRISRIALFKIYPSKRSRPRSEALIVEITRFPHSPMPPLFLQDNASHLHHSWGSIRD